MPWSFGDTLTSTLSLTPPVALGALGALMPLSTSTACPASLAVAVLVCGLYVVTRLTVVFEPWSFGCSSISTTWFAALGSAAG